MANIADIGLAIEIRFESILTEETGTPYPVDRLIHVFRETEHQMQDILAHETIDTDRGRFAKAVLHETGPAIHACKEKRTHMIYAHINSLVTMAKQYRYSQIRKQRQATRSLAYAI